ncbi:hypothetical protein Bbelb_218960 [Branchiostoma belcheri]|nr:hypothetical protein Bbelb_218960 [Branchiostoma belcheri]
MEKVDELPAINENVEDVESHIYNIDFEDIDSHTYNYIDHDEVQKEPQAREHHISAGTPHVTADNKVTNPLTNAMNEPGGLQQTKHGATGNNSAGLIRNAGYVPGPLRQDQKEGSTSAENICGRLKRCKFQRPSLLRVIAIALPIVALLSAGVCAFMYFTSAGNKNADTKNSAIKESSNERLPESRLVSSALLDNTTELPDTVDTYPNQSRRMPGLISTDTTGTSTKFSLHNHEEGLITEKTTERPTTVGVHVFARPPKHVPRCKNGYSLLAGTCIRLSVTEQSYDKAMAACKEEGATLAVPKTKELDVPLRDLVKDKGDNKEHWIGMRDKGGWLRWIWTWEDVNESLVNEYKAWNPGQPKNPRLPGVLCGQYWSDPTGSPMWDDDACYKSKRFICQHSPA